MNYVTELTFPFIAIAYENLNFTGFAHSQNERQQSFVKFTSRSFKTLLHILAATKEREIREACRELVIDSLLHINGPEELLTTEQQNCLYYEASLWVDGVSDYVIPHLEKNFDVAQKRSIEHVVFSAQACSNIGSSGLGRAPCFSSFLNFALCSLRSSECPSAFRCCVLEVVSSCLFYHLDPIPLAALVILHLDASEGRESSVVTDDLDSPAAALLNYSRQIVDFRKGETDTRSLSLSLKDVLEKILHKRDGHQASVCQLFVSSLNEDQENSTLPVLKLILRDFSDATTVAVTRQILHYLTFMFDRISRHSHLFTMLRWTTLFSSAVSIK